MRSYASIVRFLEEAIGLDPESIGVKALEHAVSSLAERSRIPDCRRYLETLKHSHADLQQLIDAVVVPETWFFRDSEPFVFLREQVQSSGLAIASAAPLRILSVACSSGEEPYSIVMALQEEGLSPQQFHIDAVDVSKKAIEKARQALYGKGSFRNGSMPYQSRYFSNTGHGFKLDTAVSTLVHFSIDNLLSDHFLADRTPYQVIFCRNVLIYLSRKARSRVVAHLDRLLAMDGLLFAGHAEVPFFQQAGYVPVEHPRSFACRKPGAVPQVKKKPAAHAALVKERAAGSAFGAVQQTEISPHLPLLKREEAAPSARKHKGKAPPPESTSAASLITAVRTRADQGLFAEASALAEQYLREHGADAEIYCLMGLIQQARNCPEPAEDYFLKALYLDPSYYDVLIHLSLLCEHRGDTARAALFQQRAQRLQARRT